MRRRNKRMVGEGPAPGNDAVTLFEDDGNALRDGRDERHAVDPRAGKIAVACVCLVALYGVALVIPKDLLNWGLHLSQSNAVGGGYTFSWFVRDLQANVANLAAVLTGNAGETSVGYVSLMLRYVVIALAGAGLALSGAVYQGAFRNALVAPSTLGVMTGAGFGLSLWVVLFATDASVLAFLADGEGAAGDAVAYLSSSYGVAALSFACALFVVGLVLITMRVAGGGTSGIMMILTGQMIGGVLGAVQGLIRYYYVETDPYGDIAQMLTQLQISSFWRPFTVVDVVAILVPLAATFLVVMRLQQRMMVLAFDEAEQRTMGVDSRKMQVAVVGLCTLLTAIIVSFCGSVGFVGFLVPHMARRLVGPNFRYLLPASAVLGSLFVLGAYVLLQVTLGNDYETMVGMFISIGGAAVFLATALRGKGAVRGSFR